MSLITIELDKEYVRSKNLVTFEHKGPVKLHILASNFKSSSLVKLTPDSRIEKYIF